MRKLLFFGLTVLSFSAICQTYTVTVNYGTGSGSYAVGATVGIQATIPAGKAFDKWLGDTSLLDRPANQSIAYINSMPSHDIVFTATFKDGFTLTVNNGSGPGAGTTWGAGTVFGEIEADNPPPGKIFDKWIGDIAGITPNVYSKIISYTMSAANAVITATYKDSTGSYYTLTVTNGTGSAANLSSGEVIAITADAPIAGKVFDKWTGDTAGIANVNSSSTTIIMPSSNVAITAIYKDIALAIASEQQLISIYPNPVSEQMNVVIPEDKVGSLIIISNLMGRILISRKTDQPENVINIESLVSGIYNLSLLNNGNTQTSLIIKN